MPIRRRTPLRPRLGAVSLISVCLTTLSPAVAGAATHPRPESDPALQRQLEDLVRRPGGPPGIIAVLKDGHKTQVVKAGVAELETKRKPRPHDHMRIASAAKAFSGAVALSLVNLGDLSLDDTLGERLPSLPDAWAAVTLRQLLNHTSGLPDYSKSDGFIKTLLADPRHHFDSRKLLDYVADRDLEFPPGSRYHYSNSDNIAVALVAEAATGERYERLLKELVYRPLGMHRTSLPQGYRMPTPFLHGYDVSPPEPTEDVSELISMSGVWASGGIVSTPADMTRFIRGYAGGKLYGPDVVKEQRAWIAGASEPAGPGKNKAGLALFRYTTRCGVVLGHTGNTPGYTQLIAATPDGRKSLTFSTTTQINQTLKPDLLRKLRAVQENFVCALLKGKS
ncbi:beta-lactamase [Streptomyces davaonensis JCM 4913]|uniref:Beta-lactamase n=1 Tax=Streptomyces davaonensis (strain DSM 101723 / JCM 4913 / KCC S-0913 / 768) TaxID=1214101 RepID=K4QTA4_STRDJ|nr:serine hydrolase domain-containing protein [Streptomyces davaonensis]CCK26056.1 beta-lactamase [Streptomyces davaonensis JCM 4913]